GRIPHTARHLRHHYRSRRSHRDPPHPARGDPQRPLPDARRRSGPVADSENQVAPGSLSCWLSYGGDHPGPDLVVPPEEAGMTLDRVTEPTDRRSAGTLANLRDVGTASPLLRRGVLYRSDAPLSTDEPPLAHPWPPTTVIDLRDHGEKAEPHPYRHTSRVVDLPLLAGSVRAPQTLANGLAALYTHLLHTPTTASLLVAAVQTIAEADGGVLVHCTAGKDRTGVTVAIAL